MDMRRVAVLLVGISVILLPSIVAAGGLLGFGLPGLPSFGLGGGSGAGCGVERSGPGCCTEFFVGWMTAQPGVTFSARTNNGPLGAATNGLEHKYNLQGLWLGVSQTCQLADKLGFVASGWYLIPSNQTSQEVYDLVGVAGPRRSWQTDNKWWYVDGLLSMGNLGGFTLLAGARYDYQSTNFQSPEVGTVGGLTSDSADVSLSNIIPLVGTQYALNCSQSQLLVRAVGIPTLVGTVKYNETLAGASRYEVSGNYRGGYFLEVFADYAYKFGAGDVGAFLRWNMANGKSDVDTNLVGAASQQFDLNLQRNTWTFGGKVSYCFNLPL
jgi:hypothetical protein